MLNQLLHVFDFVIQFIQRSVTDLSDQQMVEQPDAVPNHGMWTLGHVIFSCQGVAIELGAQPWLPGDWESTFGYESTPVPDSARYLTRLEMLSLLADAANRLRQTLRAADESVFRTPSSDETMPAVGDIVLQVVAAHTAYHAGQLAVWRRAIGMPSAGVFI